MPAISLFAGQAGAGQVAPNSQSPRLRRLPDRPALNKLGIDPRLAGVFLPVADVFGPADDPAHHRTVVPVEMGDGGQAPGEGWIGFGANQRDLGRSVDAAVGEMVLGCVEEERLVK